MPAGRLGKTCCPTISVGAGAPASGLGVERAGVDHHARAAGDLLLARLEEEADAAAQLVANRVEDLRRAEERGRVRVVPAGVHRAVVLRDEVERVLLADRQRVHVGAEGERGAGLRAPNRCDDARLRDARLHGHAVEIAQRFGDERGGGVLLERELGVAVERPPRGDDVVEEFGVEGVDAIFHRR